MKLENLYICPKCKGRLDRSNKDYECKNCQTQYPVLDNIPVFITGEIDSDTMSTFWDKGWQNRLEKTDQQFLVKENRDELKKQLLKNLDYLAQSKHAIMETLPIGDKIVLNIGCGTGEAPWFTAMGAENYIGLDYSFFAAKKSFENIKKLGGKGITAQANAELLPIENDSIDMIYSNGVLHHTPETQKTLDEVYRVLKPSGKAVIGLYNTYSPHFINDRIIGSFKAMINNNHKNWYEFGEGDWRTENSTNQWTKTYSKKELSILFSKYQTKDLNFRKTGFSWGNAMPKLGKYIDKTRLGTRAALYLHQKLGGMWVITFTKK